MRFPPTLLLYLPLVCGVQTLGQSVPPGAPVPHSDDIPLVQVVPRAPIQSPTAPRPQVDPLELRREANQVLDLSKSIQLDVEAVAQGAPARDCIEKLRRIEKLSKRLRYQIER